MFLENTVNHKEQFGWIEVICGSMFSGKTEELLRRLRRAKIANIPLAIFKPELDTRYAEMRRLVSEGVGGIMTDRPDLLRQILDASPRAQ